MERLLIVVPCGQRKIWDIDPGRGPTPARDAYVGPPFKVNRNYAEKFADRWVILSAKYGFIDPNFVIPVPYNVSFKKPSTRPLSAELLRNQVRAKSLGAFQLIIGLGGKEYRHAVRNAFAGLPVSVQFPFAGLPIGKAMRATKKAIETNTPVP